MMLMNLYKVVSFSEFSYLFIISFFFFLVSCYLTLHPARDWGSLAFRSRGRATLQLAVSVRSVGPPVGLENFRLMVV